MNNDTMQQVIETFALKLSEKDAEIATLKDCYKKEVRAYADLFKRCTELKQKLKDAANYHDHCVDCVDGSCDEDGNGCFCHCHNNLDPNG